MITETNTMVNIGLAEGLAGKVLLGLLDCERSGEIDKRRKVESLLDFVGENMVLLEDFSFDHGIVGIGWMIAYCAQRQLLLIDSDEILADVDDEIYKYTLNVVSNQNSNNSEILELIDYFKVRLLNANINGLYYRRFSHLECLKLLSDKLCKSLQSTNYFENPLAHSQEISKILLKCSYLMVTCMTEKLFDQPFYSAMEGFADYYENMTSHTLAFDQNISQHIEICLLLCMTAKQYRNPHWVDRFEAYYLILKKELRSPKLETANGYKRIQVMESIYLNPILDSERFAALMNENTSMALLIFYLTNYNQFQLKLF